MTAMGNTWQVFCTNELRRHIAMGRTGEAAWAVRRWELFEQAQREQGATGRIIIADLNAAAEDLRKFSFFSCYLIRCDFSRADLAGADFEFSMVRESIFNGAKLERATFENADLAGPNQFLKVTTKGRINFVLGRRDLPDMMDEPLKRLARQEWSKQDDDRHEGNPFVRLVRRALGYGLNIGSVAGVSLGLVLAYALAWLAAPIADGQPFVARASAALMCSGRYFLGLTDVFAPADTWWAALGLSETALGLFMLAMLIAALTRRLTISE